MCWVRGGSFLRGEPRGQAVGGLSCIRVWWLRWSRLEVQCAVQDDYESAFTKANGVDSRLKNQHIYT